MQCTNSISGDNTKISGVQRKVRNSDAKLKTTHLEDYLLLETDLLYKIITPDDQKKCTQH